MEDKQIIDLYFRRDENAVTRTQEKYGGYCYRIAANILARHEDAEECVSDTWLRAWNAIPPARPDPLRLFLGKITRNLSLQRWRASRAKKRGGGEAALAYEELSDCLPGGAEPEKIVETRALAEAVNAFLAALPGEERTIFLARYWFFAPLREIAKRTVKSESAVKSSLFRTRKKLREHLEREGLL